MPGLFGMNIFITVLVIGGILLVSGVKILKEYERAVIFRLGRMVDPRGPGIIYVIPLIERMLRVDLRTITMDVPPAGTTRWKLRTTAWWFSPAIWGFTGIQSLSIMDLVSLPNTVT